ncbi:P97 family adhesin [Mesomycoplasma ovipneumoniae]|uniref:P97 family adhesin n=1 Tax=Mesomycoplasma ovipneumoniae TaxID=29562 RepID=UPI00083E8BE1|nr:hypothetical protein [Mesomycoplasma ovipneumoniae]
MSKPKQKSLFNVLRKNILSKTGIAVSLFGIGVFTATAVLTTRISYSGNPRENVQNFAKNINLVSFKLGDLSANDDYYSIKNIIFDENGNKQNDLDLSRLVDVFQKINDLNQKIDLTDEVDLQKPHLKFVDITANDNSRSFEIKYQVKQKLPDQSFVYSDIYSQEISFLQKSQFLRSNFSSKLQKIIKLFQTKFSSLKDKNSAKQFSANLENTKTTLKDNIFLSRAEDISSFFNLARTSKELENKISKLLPQIEHILFDLYNSEENLIPDSNNKIFNFSFEKNQLTNEYAFVDGSGFLNLFLKAEFSLEAQKLLDFPEVKSWIEPVRIVDNEGKSLFTTSKSLIDSIELSNTESKKLVNISVLDFLNLLQTKFTLSNFDIKNEKINKEIVQIINQVLEKPLNIGLKNSSNKLPNEGVNLVFDPFNVEISKNDSKFDLKLPYKIQISEKFYGNESSEIVEEKLGVLNLENFSIIDENSDQKIDDGRYFLFLNPNFDLKMLKKDDAAKDKQEIPEVKDSEKTEGSEPEQVAVQEAASTESQSTTTTQPAASDTTAQTESTTEAEGNTQTKKQPKYKYFLLDSNNPYSKKEIDQLIQDNDFEKLNRHLQNLSGYNYNFSDHESLIKAWSGTLIFPFDYANSFVKDTSLHAQKTGTISLNSTQFLQNPNETGAFYSFLAKQNPRIVVQAFVDFLKTSGLIFNFVDLDRDYNFDWNKIFESARQVKLNSSNFKKFSFNNQYTNLQNSGFLSTLFLTKDVKSKISTLKNDGTILESLTSLNLFALNSDEIAKFEKIDENITNFETLADVISAFYFKAGLLNNYQNWSEIALLDSEIIFEPNDEISLSELEEIKKQNPSSGQSQDASKNYKAINYYYKLGIKDESGKISVPLFESPKTTLILKTIDEKTAKINEITKKLDQIIDAIPVSYQTIHLSAEDFDKLTNANTVTTSGSEGSVAVQSALVSSIYLQNLEPKELVKLFNDTEQPQQGEETQETQETQQAEVEQQVQEVQETEGEQQTQDAETTESNGETQTTVETETPVEPQQKQDELTQKLPKFGAEISQILNKSFASLFTSTEKDSPKLKINIEIKDDILKDPNKKLITIQVGIPESYLEKLTADEIVDQKEKNDETSSDQAKTDQGQTDSESTSDQGQTDQQQNNGSTSDQGTGQQESGSTEPATVETKQVLASESPASPSPAPAPAAASPAPAAEPATSPAPTPASPASPAPAEAPTPPTEQPKEEKYRYSKRFNITVIKQVSQSQTTTESTPESTVQS